MQKLKDRIIKRSVEFWKSINYDNLKSPSVILHLVGWIASFLLLIISIETDTNWKEVWIIFYGYFWYKLNKDILHNINPPVELLLILILFFYSIEYSYANSIFKSLAAAGTKYISSDPLGLASNILLAVLVLLFGLILIINSGKNQTINFYANDDRNRKKKYNQGVLFIYTFVGLFAHILIFYEHVYYLYLFQFFLILILISKTSWVERLSKNELWIYFFVFLSIYSFINDPAGFQLVKSISANQKATWFSLPYYLHFLVKTYFLVLLIKIPIVLIYNHAGLERKLRIAGLFQSTFPQFIQFVFLIAIFFFFIAGWQSERLREILLSQDIKMLKENVASGITHRIVYLNQQESKVKIPGYLPIGFPEEYPKVGVFQLQVAESYYGGKDYFLYFTLNQTQQRRLHFIKIDTVFTKYLANHLSVLVGSGLILYPYALKTWQKFFSDQDLLQADSDIRIYPFDITSENSSWSIITSIQNPDSNFKQVHFISQEDIFGNQKFTIGRVFLPIVNATDSNLKYFAFDIFFSMQMSLTNSTMSKIVLALVILFLLLNVFVIRRVGKFGTQINRIIVQKFNSLKSGIREISAGNLDYKFKMEGEDEFVELAGHFNQMGDKLKKTIAEAREKDRLDHELKIARQVQLNLLPTKLPEIAGYKIAASLKTANEVGGDLYDLIPLTKNKYLFTIGDVSGKGSSAAFYMAQFISLLRFSPQFTHVPIEIALRLNKYFSTQIADRQIFITAIIGILDINSDTITFVRAGHNPPLKIPGNINLDIKEINTNGLGIGLTKRQQKFKNTLQIGKIKLYKGDMLVFYTDGVVEAAIPSKVIKNGVEIFGEDRFKQILIEYRGREAHELVVAVTDALNIFYGNHPQVDDHTLVIIQKSL